MTNHDELITALRIPMDVTLPGAPELDEYNEQRKAAADALDAAWAEATAAAYGAAVDVCKKHKITSEEIPLIGEYTDDVENIISALTPQSARDWLAEREAAIRAEERAKVISMAAHRMDNGWSYLAGNAIRGLHTDASRALQIKEKTIGDGLVKPLDGKALLVEAVVDRYGERCSYYQAGCACCAAWRNIDHIEELEAKLAKAVDVIEWALTAWDDHNKYGDGMQGDWVYDARAAIAEINGGGDE